MTCERWIFWLFRGGRCSLTVWRKLTLEVLVTQGNRCSICRKRIDPKAKGEKRLVGHHIINRCRGRIDTADNCEARHADCESWAHKTWKGGNPK